MKEPGKKKPAVAIGMVLDVISAARSRRRRPESGSASTTQALRLMRFRSSSKEATKKAKNWKMFAARLRKGEIGRNTTEGNTVVGGLMVYVGFSC